jgi:hypothetical protein
MFQTNRFDPFVPNTMLLSSITVCLSASIPQQNCIHYLSKFLCKRNQLENSLPLPNKHVVLFEPSAVASLAFAARESKRTLKRTAKTFLPFDHKSMLPLWSTADSKRK